ncbi:hypothetical protein FSP39_024073 [Pinctada imbricata]|uniref:Uncharacterized protein n=1 Tax=Pinctada imbricata TaxID=66713 RepID=A0AA89BP90_PINIB|nr:hypothetical protein FSP39_024073 [Pinctada imbricata]
MTTMYRWLYYDYQRTFFSVDYHDLPTIDSEIPTTDTETVNWEANALDILAANDEQSDTEGGSDTEADEHEENVCTIDDMNDYVMKMKQFAIRSGHAKIMSALQCFDDHVIPLEGGNSKPIPVPKIAGDIIVPLQLPQGLVCQFCTMQFTFITATVPHCNQGRKCTFGNEQEITIVNCADIQIISQQDEFPSEFLWPDYNSQYSSLHGVYLSFLKIFMKELRILSYARNACADLKKKRGGGG